MAPQPLRHLAVILGAVLRGGQGAEGRGGTVGGLGLTGLMLQGGQRAEGRGGNRHSEVITLIINNMAVRHPLVRHPLTHVLTATAYRDSHTATAYRDLLTYSQLQPIVKF